MIYLTHPTCLQLASCYRAVNNICPKVQTLLTYYSIIISVPAASLLAAVHLLTRLLAPCIVSLMVLRSQNLLAESCDAWEKVHMQVTYEVVGPTVMQEGGQDGNVSQPAIMMYEDSPVMG